MVIYVYPYELLILLDFCNVFYENFINGRFDNLIIFFYFLSNEN